MALSDSHLEPGKVTFNPSVRIGNWYEDLSLEEDFVKEFIYKKENGELLIQKTSELFKTVAEKIEIASDKEYLCYGDKVLLIHLPTNRTLSAHIPLNVLHLSDVMNSPCQVTASPGGYACLRNTFNIESINGNEENGEPVRFSHPFYLRTQSGPGGELFLHSDMASFKKDAKYSREQEVLLVDRPSYFCAWRLLCYSPSDRLETEGEPVPAKTLLLINHCKTNQNLSVLTHFSYKTAFGLEHEITCQTHLNKYKSADTQNHWIIVNRESKHTSQGESPPETSAVVEPEKEQS